MIIGETFLVDNNLLCKAINGKKQKEKNRFVCFVSALLAATLELQKKKKKEGRNVKKSHLTKCLFFIFADNEFEQETCFAIFAHINSEFRRSSAWANATRN